MPEAPLPPGLTPAAQTPPMQRPVEPQEGQHKVWGWGQTHGFSGVGFGVPGLLGSFLARGVGGSRAWRGVSSCVPSHFSDSPSPCSAQSHVAHRVPLKPYGAPVPRSQSLQEPPARVGGGGFPAAPPAPAPPRAPLARQSSDPTAPPDTPPKVGLPGHLGSLGGEGAEGENGRGGSLDAWVLSKLRLRPSRYHNELHPSPPPSMLAVLGPVPAPPMPSAPGTPIPWMPGSPFPLSPSPSSSCSQLWGGPGWVEQSPGQP